MAVKLAGELMSRALCGCVERVEGTDGTSRERHRYDNRLPDVSAAGRAVTRGFASFRWARPSATLG